MRKNKEDNLTCWRVRGFLQLELWVVEAETNDKEKPSLPILCFMQEQSLSVLLGKFIMNVCPKPGFTNYPVYQLCLQIRRTLIIVGQKTDLQRLHSFHFISINWKYFYFSAEIILLCIISNMLCLDVTPSFVITIIGNMILVNNVSKRYPRTLSTKEKNCSSYFLVLKLLENRARF